MKIEILGSGCEKCKKLAANAKEATDKLGVACEMEKVTDINKITGYGVMMTPALVIDGKVASSGKVLSPDEIAAFLKQDTAPAASCCRGGDEKLKERKSPCCCGGVESGTRDAEAPCCCRGTGKSGKKTLTFVLLAFVAASVVFVLAREMNTKKGAAAPAAPIPAETKTVPVQNGVLTVYYFHGTRRCMTCNKIEQMTRTAVESKYADEMKAGKVIFRSVNLDEPANAHYVDDFQLTSRMVVVECNGKHENLDQVWSLVHGDSAKFAAYIQDGAARILAAAK